MFLFEDAKRESATAATNFLLDRFDQRNMLVVGGQGTGKDLCFSHVIQQRNEHHNALYKYSRKTTVIKVSDLSLAPNTFENIIQGIFVKVPGLTRKFRDGEDTFLPDLGIFLPAQYNAFLDKKFETFSMFYPLGRQLFDMGIHCNVQDITRPWNKIREQADGFLFTLRTEDCGEVLKVYCIYYTRREDAEGYIMPNNHEDAERRGISAHIIRVNKSEIEYDTRYFREKFLNIRNSRGSKIYPSTRYLTNGN